MRSSCSLVYHRPGELYTSTLIEHTRSPMESERQTLTIGILGSLALGIQLAPVNGIIHIKPNDSLATPVISMRSLTWMVLFYGGASAVAAVLFRRASPVLAVTISGFVFAQCGLWFYRTDIVVSVVTPRAITVLGVALLADSAHRSKGEKRAPRDQSP